MPSTAMPASRRRSSRACASSKPFWPPSTSPGNRLKFMAKKVRIPTPLRKLTNNEEVVEVNASTIYEVIAELQARYPGFKERLLDDSGAVRRFVNVYVNEEDIRFLENQH